MAACQFYRDPSRKVDFTSLKQSQDQYYKGIEISENKALSSKTYGRLCKQRFISWHFDLLLYLTLFLFAIPYCIGLNEKY